MRVVILAGGLGSRLGEITEVRPKPMVEIGGRPILWHIMKYFSHHGFREFVLALGYKGDIIKRYFLDYPSMSNSITVDLGTGQVRVHDEVKEDWNVHLVDTGLRTMTGGRVERVRPWVRDGTFIVTYSDGVCDLDLEKLVSFHRQHGRLATMTAVRSPARFGALTFSGDDVVGFAEKPQTDEGWINGGFLVFEPAVLDRIASDETSLESDVLQRLAADGQLAAYRHPGFWQCMDTPRDLSYLESLWAGGHAPWKAWP